MQLPNDYEQRVYAGVLGKIIGVYLGRPFEGWSNELIERELGEITGYVNQRLKRPLIVTDDDISGTFTFPRALEDYGVSRELAAVDIGRSWLNYLIEERTVLWWGGLGNSTEHTAYLRLKRGIEAPRSGSIELNTKVVAEQIGAQIFIDGWAMIAPGDPELAAAFAARAGSVSHDGEAVYGAQVVAAMEAAAFVEPDLDKLLDIAVGLIPDDSVIAQLIRDLREWHAADGDWRATFRRVQATYGYDTYGGNCHMVPNHAVIILALLYGAGDFSRSLMIGNTCGWDTDCNSGNIGCILGIRNGLDGLGPAPVGGAATGGNGGTDWRGPVADRILLPTAEGGRCITDALQAAYRLVNLGRTLAAQPPVAPKAGARFHFSLPGSVQGFLGAGATTAVGNRDGKLLIRFSAANVNKPARCTTATFMPLDADRIGGYQLLASPTIHSGQRLRARLIADAGNADPLTGRLVAQVYEDGEDTSWITSPEQSLGTDGSVLAWQVPDTGGRPIAQLGVEISGDGCHADGAVLMDWLTWEGTPRANLGRPDDESLAYRRSQAPWWRRAWVNGCSGFMATSRGESYRLVQNEGVGLAMQGSEQWQNYRFTATVRIHMATAGGIGVRVGGMRRYYALLMYSDGAVRLVRRDHDQETLAEGRLQGGADQEHRLSITVAENTLTAEVDEDLTLEASDAAFTGGGVALICEEGRVEVGTASIAPA